MQIAVQIILDVCVGNNKPIIKLAKMSMLWIKLEINYYSK